MTKKMTLIFLCRQRIHQRVKIYKTEEFTFNKVVIKSDWTDANQPQQEPQHQLCISTDAISMSAPLATNRFGNSLKLKRK